MQCPFCGLDKDKVIDSRSAEQGKVIRRRRECLRCKRRFTTYERVEETVRLMVVKKDGSRVPYDRGKIISGLTKACYKRPVSAERIQTLVEEIEDQLYRTYDKEVETTDIGQIASDKLKAVDRVAYVRFASVYKQFRDIEDFLAEVKEVMDTAAPLDGPTQGKLF
ncbi:transcriptional repressor NrdR [Planctomycetales bacterium ZRK34]|nr:transcriptional repressor NrdR [Planctomycetales bacterium ZRK34]